MSQHAVLFIVFNRPDTTEQVLNAIRTAGVTKLYIAADGARQNNEKDPELCRQVRQLVSNIDWPCEVKTLFRDENRGCRFGPSEAIDWFFSHESAGIILEDDCLPHPDFFEYCNWALDEFRDNKKIWHINGNNFAASPKLYRAPVDFTSLAQVWGWATWADRWNSSQINPFYIRENAKCCDAKWQLSPIAKKVKKFHIERLCLGLDAWDYQWQVTILNHQGLCVSPRSNLISNIGDSSDASHTKKDRRTHLGVQPIEQTLTYSELMINTTLNNWYEKQMGLRRLCFAAINDVIDLSRRALIGFRSMTSDSSRLPIVIASSGRSGSTMLCDAIAGSYINHKFALGPGNALGQGLSRLSRCFVDRLEYVSLTKCPVQKTHAILREEFLDDARYIFVYGAPLESALSVKQMTEKKGTRWLEKHLFHLESVAHPDVRDLFQKDLLNYKIQITSWLSVKHRNLLTINYEDLWDRQIEISQFLGFPISLPPRKVRATKPKLDHHNVKLFDDLALLMKSYENK